MLSLPATRYVYCVTIKLTPLESYSFQLSSHPTKHMKMLQVVPVDIWGRLQNIPWSERKILAREKIQNQASSDIGSSRLTAV